MISFVRESYADCREKNMLMADVELPANTRETVRLKTFHEPVVCASECQNIRIHVIHAAYYFILLLCTPRVHYHQF